MAPSNHLEPMFRYDHGAGFSDNVWTSAAMKYNGTLGSDPRMFVYKDGTQLGAGENAEGDNLLTTNSDVQIGKRVNGRYLEGDLDELRISNITRSDDYIQTRYNNEQASSTFLTIGVQEPPTTTVSPAISASSDDAEEDVSGGGLDTGSSDLEMMDDGGLQEIGIRFTNVQVPQNATIISADVQFAVDQAAGQSGATTITISGELRSNDNPPTFAGSSNITSRTKSTVNVDWSPADWAVPPHVIN